MYYSTPSWNIPQFVTSFSFRWPPRYDLCSIYICSSWTVASQTVAMGSCLSQTSRSVGFFALVAVVEDTKTHMTFGVSVNGCIMQKTTTDNKSIEQSYEPMSFLLWPLRVPKPSSYDDLVYVVRITKRFLFEVSMWLIVSCRYYVVPCEIRPLTLDQLSRVSVTCNLRYGSVKDDWGKPTKITVLWTTHLMTDVVSNVNEYVYSLMHAPYFCYANSEDTSGRHNLCNVLTTNVLYTSQCSLIRHHARSNVYKDGGM